MTQQLTVTQLWALISAGPLAMVLTVLVGILINNQLLKSEIRRVEEVVTTKLGALAEKLDALTGRVKALEDEIRSPLVKR
jgi:hypothetical protein